MKFHQSLYVTVAAVLFTGLSTASAHFNITGNRTLNSGNPIDGITATNNVRTVSGSFGWADATDDNWGNTHRLTPFKFTLANMQTVSITVARNLLGSGSNGTFLPAFSLDTTPAFVGDGHDESNASRAYLAGLFGTTAVGESFVNTNGNGGWHAGDPFVDSNFNSVWDSGEQFTDVNGLGVWEPGDSFTDTNGNGVFDGAGIDRSGKDGVFRALAPWKIFQDSVAGTEVNFDTIIGHAADGTAANYGGAPGINGDGTADGTVSSTFANLAAGDYFLVVGGVNYAGVNTDTLAGGLTFLTYGIDVSATATPEPTSVVLLAFGAVGWGLMRRRKA